MRNFTRTWGEGKGLFSHFAQTSHFKKIMRVSTACLALVFAAGFQFLQAEMVHSQTIDNTYVDIEASHVSLRYIFVEIENQTNFLFVFPPDLVDKYDDVSAPKGSRSVRDVLQSAMKGSGLGYLQSGETVSIFEAKKERVVANAEFKALIGKMAVVTGTVKDAGGSVIAGVNVLIRGTTKGTATDAEGKYSIDAASDDWLVFSFIGFKQFEVQVQQQTVVDVVLQDDATALQEVVVSTGYYNMNDKSKTANIVKIKSDEIGRQPVTSPLLSLQGRVAGLEISPINGASGAAPKIRIRGENSLRSNGGNPLYIVDGVMVDANPIQSQTNIYFYGIDPLSNINHENIESIEVLKDADATAIYGSRGANGVILITTKRASSGRLNVEFTGYSGAGRIPHFVDLLNTQQYLQMRREAFKNAGAVPSQYNYELTQWDTTRSTDWQRELLDGSANIMDYQINISAGNKNTVFRLGGGYHKETTFATDKLGFNRSSGSFTFNHRSDDGKFSVSFSANYGMARNKSASIDALVKSALTLPPDAPSLYQQDGSLNWGIIDYGAFKAGTLNNPLATLLNTSESRIGSLVTNSNIGYEVLNGLSVKLNLGYTEGNGDEIVKSPMAALPPTARGPWSTGTALFSNSRRGSWLVEPQLSYTKSLGNHGLDLLLGSTFQEMSSRWQAVSANGYKSDVLLNSLLGAASYFYGADERALYRYSALFARIGYNWKDKYIVNLTGRRDGSSRFGPGNQFGNFGAVGAAWIISNERFMQGVSRIVNFAKLRASYGTTGNDLIGDYQYYNLFRIGGANYQNLTTLKPNGLFNENFNWEVTRKSEVSIESEFLDNRISIQATWYRNSSSNQLVNYQLPATTGFQSILSNFNATVENRGWEFVLQTHNIRGRDFSWSTSINFTAPENELTSFPGIDTSPYSKTYKVGEPLAIRYQYNWKGVDPATGVHVIEDVNEDGLYSDVDKRFGNPMVTKVYGGVFNSIKFKTFECSFLIQFADRLGLGPVSTYPGMGLNNQPVNVMDRWRKEGDVSNIAKFSSSYDMLDPYLRVVNSNYNIVDASFVRIKTVSVSYGLPNFLTGRLNLKDARIFVQGQNLVTWTDFIGLDPETGYEFIPQLRMYTAGIQVKF